MNLYQRQLDKTQLSQMQRVNKHMKQCFFIYFLQDYRTSDVINRSIAVIINYQLTGVTAVMVLYVDVSNDISFRHVDRELTVACLCSVNLDFEDSQNISGSRFTHDVVGAVDCLRDGVCHKFHRHVECCWY